MSLLEAIFWLIVGYIVLAMIFGWWPVANWPM